MSYKQEKFTIHYHNSEGDHPYFTIAAANGEVVATSQMYDSKQGRNHTAEVLKANFLLCEIKDENGKELI